MTSLSNHQPDQPMSYVYHYHAIYQPEAGATGHLDGLIELKHQIENGERLWELRDTIARPEKIDSAKLTICSLTMIATKPTE